MSSCSLSPSSSLIYSFLYLLLPLQSSPLLCMEPDCGYLYTLQWSPTRPLVFALGSGDGQVILYDLKVGSIVVKQPM